MTADKDVLLYNMGLLLESTTTIQITRDKYLLKKKLLILLLDP